MRGCSETAWLGEVLAPTRVFPLITPTNTSSRGPRGLTSLPATCEPHRVAATVQRRRPELTSTKLHPCPALPPTLTLKAKHKNKGPLNPRETQTPVQQPSTPTGPRKGKGPAGPGPPRYIPPCRGALPQPVPMPVFEVRGTGRIFFFFFPSRPTIFPFSLYARPLGLGGRRMGGGKGRYKGLFFPCRGEACCSMSLVLSLRRDPCRDGTREGREEEKARNRMPGLPTWRALARGILVFPPGCPLSERGSRLPGRAGQVPGPSAVHPGGFDLPSAHRICSVCPCE